MLRLKDELHVNLFCIVEWDWKICKFLIKLHAIEKEKQYKYIVVLFPDWPLFI